MIRRLPSWLRWLCLALAAGLAARVAFTFPWESTIEAAGHADARFLAAALVLSLASLAAKGYAWHLLMKPVLPSTWRTAQEANLLGAAVNGVSVALTGEAARLAHAEARTGGDPRLIGASIACARAAEGIGLAILLSVMPFVMTLPEIWTRIQIVTAILFWTGAAALLLARRSGRVGRLSFVRRLEGLGSPRQFVFPVALGLVNWALLWAAFHLVLEAVTPVTAAASFVALMAVNIGGLFRPLPANVGVFQVSMAAGLVPFGVHPEQAVAAGLLLQAVQVPPVILLGIALVGFRGLVKGEGKWTIAPSTTSI